MITLGSTNTVKIEALREVLAEYPKLAEFEVSGISAASQVSEQPLSEEETIRGAINRAKESWGNCILSVGIESGLRKSPFTKNGYMEFSVCAIYDGKEFHLGQSCAFEPPGTVMKHVLDGQDLSQACTSSGLTSNPDIGQAEGIIGILTKGKITRKEYTKQAIHMALIHLNT